MFVLNACWSATNSRAKTLTVSERTAQMMRDGGVAVSITNVCLKIFFLNFFKFFVDNRYFSFFGWLCYRITRN